MEGEITSVQRRCVGLRLGQGLPPKKMVRVERVDKLDKVGKASSESKQRKLSTEEGAKKLMLIDR